MFRRSNLWHNLTAYDAAYVVLAETLASPLLIADGALSRSTVTGRTLNSLPSG